MVRNAVEKAHYLTCPYCGFEDYEGEALFLDNRTDEHDVTCQRCDSAFHAIRVLEVSYSSYTLDATNDPDGA